MRSFLYYYDNQDELREEVKVYMQSKKEASFKNLAAGINIAEITLRSFVMKEKSLKMKTVMRICDWLDNNY